MDTLLLLHVKFLVDLSSEEFDSSFFDLSLRNLWFRWRLRIFLLALRVIMALPVFLTDVTELMTAPAGHVFASLSLRNPSTAFTAMFVFLALNIPDEGLIDVVRNCIFLASHTIMRFVLAESAIRFFTFMTLIFISSILVVGCFTVSAGAPIVIWRGVKEVLELFLLELLDELLVLEGLTNI